MVESRALPHYLLLSMNCTRLVVAPLLLRLMELAALQKLNAILSYTAVCRVALQTILVGGLMLATMWQLLVFIAALCSADTAQTMLLTKTDSKVFATTAMAVKVSPAHSNEIIPKL